MGPELESKQKFSLVDLPDYTFQSWSEIELHPPSKQLPQKVTQGRRFSRLILTFVSKMIQIAIFMHTNPRFEKKKSFHVKPLQLNVELPLQATG